MSSKDWGLDSHMTITRIDGKWQLTDTWNDYKCITCYEMLTLTACPLWGHFAHWNLKVGNLNTCNSYHFITDLRISHFCNFSVTRYIFQILLWQIMFQKVISRQCIYVENGTLIHTNIPLDPRGRNTCKEAATKLQRVSLKYMRWYCLSSNFVMFELSDHVLLNKNTNIHDAFQWARNNKIINNNQCLFASYQCLQL